MQQDQEPFHLTRSFRGTGYGARGAPIIATGLESA